MSICTRQNGYACMHYNCPDCGDDMTSKSELKRLATLAPAEMAERLHKAEAEVERLKQEPRVPKALLAECAAQRDEARRERDEAMKEVGACRAELFAAQRSINYWVEERDRLAAENGRYRKALEKIANPNWEPGGSEMWAISTAREALAVAGEQ